MSALHAPRFAAVAGDDTTRWLADTPMLRIGAGPVRIQAAKLTQLEGDPCRRALACHEFVRALPLRFSAEPAAAAPLVLKRGTGTQAEKASLLVALLRASGLPARLQLVGVPPGVFRGLLTGADEAPYPAVEVCTGDRWVATDVFAMDVALALAGRKALLREGATCGWGMHVRGAAFWAGSHHAFAALPPDAVVELRGAYDDASQLPRPAASRTAGVVSQLFRVLAANARLQTLRAAQRSG